MPPHPEGLKAGQCQTWAGEEGCPGTCPREQTEPSCPSWQHPKIRFDWEGRKRLGTSPGQEEGDAAFWGHPTPHHEKGPAGSDWAPGLSSICRLRKAPGQVGEPALLPKGPVPRAAGRHSVGLVAHGHQEQLQGTESSQGTALLAPQPHFSHKLWRPRMKAGVTVPCPVCSSSGWPADPASYPASSAAGPSWLGPGTCPWSHCRRRGLLPG